MGIIVNFIYQIIFTIGVLVVFGLLISLCRKAFCKIIGESGNKILLITGAVGTPIHELSHALMCIIFGHKIVEIKLYQPNQSDGTLGFVKHTYNKKNLYHQIGNFFIGVAPIICGSAVLYILMYLLVPNIYLEVVEELKFISLLSTDLFDLSTYSGFFDLFLEIINDILNFTNIGSFAWWIFIIFAIMISSHMELSTADIKGGLKGLLYLAGILLIADIIIYLISFELLENITMAITSITLSLTGFFCVSLIFLVIMILIALSICGIKKIIKK